MDQALTLPTITYEKQDIPIRYFSKEFKDGMRILDVWQRLDGWSGKERVDYKPDFIKAILEGSDIPKIMEYTLLGDDEEKKRILDGGHRTRAIHEFKEGEFPVKLQGNYYWWKLSDGTDRPDRENSTGRNKVLPNTWKNRFDNYSLTVTTYKDLTDEEARIKFNELNHCRPMNIPEVINSHSSMLVDYLRKEWHFISDEESIGYREVQDKFCLKKHELNNLNHMKVMTSTFSLIERDGKTDVFDYCQPGDALKYVRAKDDAGLNTQFSRSEFLVLWRKFTDAMTKYNQWFEEMKTLEDEGTDYEFVLSNHSEALTYWHYINTLPGPSVTDEKNAMIFEFSEKCHKYKKESKLLNKQLGGSMRGSTIVIGEIQEKLDSLESDVGEEVVKWLNTFTNNGAGKGNMTKRYKILKSILD